MFSSIGWGEIVVILAAGLIILGPERLPGAVSWTMQSIRKVRDYATGASGQLRDEMGSDFDQFREPIAQINELRQMGPKSVVTKHLLGGDSSSVDDLGRSVRDSLDVSKLSEESGTQASARGAGTESAAPSGDTASTGASRAHDVADWDAT